MNPETLRRVMTHLSALGASKGGFARAAALTPEERSAIARRAALARWERYRDAQREEFASIAFTAGDEAQHVADYLIGD